MEHPAATSIPTFVDALLSATFSNSCLVHESNEDNVFCVECGLSLCFHCSPRHDREHKFLKIKRYMYQNVVLLKEIKAVLQLDYSSIKSYNTNGSKVIILNPRPVTTKGNWKVEGGHCRICGKNLMKQVYSFCSLACKVQSTRNPESAAAESDQQTQEPIPESPAATSSASPSGMKIFRINRRKGVPYRSPLA